MPRLRGHNGRHDAVGVNRPYAANGPSQYTAGPATFTPDQVRGRLYDANGNLTSDGANSYGYDVENRLVSATAGGVTTSLTYDPLGRLYRVLKGASDTRFLYDGDRLVAEYGGNGALLRRYQFGAGVDEPVFMDEGSAANCTGTRFLHRDERGSPSTGSGQASSP